MSKFLVVLMLVWIAMYTFNTAKTDSQKAAATLPAISKDKTIINEQQNNAAAIADWPEQPRQILKGLTAKYGTPSEVLPGAIIWRNAGRYKCIMVTKKAAHENNFSMPQFNFVKYITAY